MGVKCNCRTLAPTGRGRMGSWGWGWMTSSLSLCKPLSSRSFTYHGTGLTWPSELPCKGASEVPPVPHGGGGHSFLGCVASLGSPCHRMEQLAPLPVTLLVWTATQTPEGSLLGATTQEGGRAGIGVVLCVPSSESCLL